MALEFIKIKRIKHNELHIFLDALEEYYIYMLEQILPHIGMYHKITSKLQI